MYSARYEVSMSNALTGNSCTQMTTPMMMVIVVTIIFTIKLKQII